MEAWVARQISPTPNRRMPRKLDVLFLYPSLKSRTVDTRSHVPGSSPPFMMWFNRSYWISCAGTWLGRLSMGLSPLILLISTPVMIQAVTTENYSQETPAWHQLLPWLDAELVKRWLQNALQTRWMNRLTHSHWMPLKRQTSSMLAS